MLLSSNHQKSMSDAYKGSLGKIKTRVTEARGWLNTLEQAESSLRNRSGSKQIEVTQLENAKPEYTDEMDNIQRVAERERAETAPRVEKKRFMNIDTSR